MWNYWISYLQPDIFDNLASHTNAPLFCALLRTVQKTFLMTIAKQSHAGCHISSSSPIALNWAGQAQQKCTSIQNAKVFNLFSFFTVKGSYLMYSENSTVLENVPDLSS